MGDVDHPPRTVNPARFWFDALRCHVFPRRALWTVAVLDRFDGQEYLMPDVRFRWHDCAQEWIERANRTWRLRNQRDVRFVIRYLKHPPKPHRSWRAGR